MRYENETTDLKSVGGAFAPHLARRGPPRNGRLHLQPGRRPHRFSFSADATLLSENARNLDLVVGGRGGAVRAQKSKRAYPGWREYLTSSELGDLDALKKMHGRVMRTAVGSLPSDQPARTVTAIREQELTGLPFGQQEVFIDRHSRLLHQLEPHRHNPLLTTHRRSINRVAVRPSVVDADSDEVAAVQFAVDLNQPPSAGGLVYPQEY